jgi:hypothetical protein
MLRCAYIACRLVLLLSTNLYGALLFAELHVEHFALKSLENVSFAYLMPQVFSLVGLCPEISVTKSSLTRKLISRDFDVFECGRSNCQVFSHFSFHQTCSLSN